MPLVRFFPMMPQVSYKKTSKILIVVFSVVYQLLPVLTGQNCTSLPPWSYEKSHDLIWLKLYEQKCCLLLSSRSFWNHLKSAALSFLPSAVMAQLSGAANENDADALCGACHTTHGTLHLENRASGLAKQGRDCSWARLRDWGRELPVSVYAYVGVGIHVCVYVCSCITCTRTCVCA